MKSLRGFDGRASAVIVTVLGLWLAGAVSAGGSRKHSSDDQNQQGSNAQKSAGVSDYWINNFATVPIPEASAPSLNELQRADSPPRQQLWAQGSTNSRSTETKVQGQGLWSLENALSDQSVNNNLGQQNTGRKRPLDRALGDDHAEQQTATPERQGSSENHLRLPYRSKAKLMSLHSPDERGREFNFPSTGSSSGDGRFESIDGSTGETSGESMASPSRDQEEQGPSGVTSNLGGRNGAVWLRPLKNGHAYDDSANEHSPMHASGGQSRQRSHFARLPPKMRHVHFAEGRMHGAGSISKLLERLTLDASSKKDGSKNLRRNKSKFASLRSLINTNEYPMPRRSASTVHRQDESIQQDEPTQLQRGDEHSANEMVSAEDQGQGVGSSAAHGESLSKVQTRKRKQFDPHDGSQVSSLINSLFPKRHRAE